MKVSKADALKMIDQKITQFESVRRDEHYLYHLSLGETTPAYDIYLQGFFGSEALLSSLFSPDEAKRFRETVIGQVRDDSSGGDMDDPRTFDEYKIRVEKCLAQLCVYRERIQNFWPAEGIEINAPGPSERASASQAAAPSQPSLRPISLFPARPYARDERLCFVLIPFIEEFRLVYDTAIKPAVDATGLTCVRADDIKQPGTIISQIWESLMRARVIIADVSGANGNVLYELGMAHVIGHEAVLLTQRIEDVPFDLRHQRHIVYEPSEAGLRRLHADLGDTLKSALAATRSA